MDAIDLLDFDASYVCGPNDYIDTATSSESTSPIMSPFDMPIIPDLGAIASSIYPSPTSSTRETASPQPTIKQEEKAEAGEGAKAATKPPAKRKRENRYKNAPPSVLSRRRAQNRASQRAYRERKDQRIKDLEALLEESKQKNDALNEAYSILHSEYVKLRGAQTRNQRHASISIPFNVPSMVVNGGPVGGMPMMDGWHMFNDMPNYSL